MYYILEADLFQILPIRYWLTSYPENANYCSTYSEAITVTVYNVKSEWTWVTVMSLHSKYIKQPKKEAMEMSQSDDKGQSCRKFLHSQQSRRRLSLHHALLRPTFIVTELTLSLTVTWFMHYFIYRRIPQIRPPFLHVSMRQNRGGGLCAGSWYCRVTTIT